MLIKRLSTTLALLSGVLLAGNAWAGSWADFGSAFPLQPCHDGWVACYLSGRTVTPELQKDGAGLPVPADMRVGWFDLEATTAFSPFGGLSPYTGELQVAVADAEPEYDEPEPSYDEPAPSYDEPAPRYDEPAPSYDEPSGGSMTRGSSEPAAPSGGSMTRSSSGTSTETPAAPSGGSMVRPSSGTDTPPSGGSSVRPSSATTGTASSVRPSTSPPSGGSMVRPSTGSTAASAPDSSGTARTSETTSAISVRPTAAAPAAVDDSCDSLVKLEPMAMMGKLTDGQSACLEASFAAAERQTEKDKISRVLMTNAYSKGDKATWAKLMKRHLEEVDQSDPDLCYKYALYLNKRGPSRAYGVIKWADVALENRTVWTGATYTSRVYSLYKLRAAAAQKIWRSAEEKYAANPAPEIKKEVEDARNQTKVYAREWYEYAKAAGKDTTKALQLCISAAGTAEYCEGA